MPVRFPGSVANNHILKQLLRPFFLLYLQGWAGHGGVVPFAAA